MRDRDYYLYASMMRVETITRTRLELLERWKKTRFSNRIVPITVLIDGDSYLGKMIDDEAD